MSEIKLKPCPFCGHEPSELLGNVGCLPCNKGYQYTVKSWNARPIEDIQVARIAELEKRLKSTQSEIDNIFYSDNEPGYTEGGDG